MRKVADMVGLALGREDVARAVRANLILKDWESIVGPALAERSAPDKFDRGTVWVAVEGSAWAQELRMLKETILKRLHSRCGEAGLFTDVRFGVRPLRRAPAPPAEAPSMPPPEGSIREIAEKRLRTWTDADAK